MANKIREAEVDADGRVVGYTDPIDDHIDEPRRGSGGFGLGLLFGVIIIAGAIMAFAYTQGSFQTAGREADQAKQVAQTELTQTAQNANTAAQNATDGNPNTNATDVTTN